MPVDRQKRPGPEKLEAALQGDDNRLRELVAEAHPADLGAWMQDFEPESVWRIWSLMLAGQRAELLIGASDNLREELVGRLMPGELVDVVEQLPTNEVVDILSIPDEATTEQVLRAVDFERAEGLRELLHYPEDSAGGLMTTDYVSVEAGTRIGDAIKEIKSQGQPSVDSVEGLYVLDPRGRPLGYVSDRDLLTHNIHSLVDESMEDVVTVGALDDQEEVARLIQKYDLASLPVVDGAGVLIGSITADEIRDVLEEEAEEDIRRLVGTSTEDQTRLPVLVRVTQRMPLQALTVLGGLGTARILGWAFPSSDADRGMDLLRYIPIIVGLAGNVGIQSSTILVRAFATGEVQPEREASVVWAETRVGMLIGLLCGAATAVVSALLEGGPEGPSWDFGVALGVAIAVAVTWASLLGCLVPMTCRRLGIDPAIVAGPFLITLSDISGATIFVGVAHLMLGIASGAAP